MYQRIHGQDCESLELWIPDLYLFNLEGHTSLVGLLDLSHERLVSAAADSTLRIWDPENGQCKSILTAHTGAITCFQHDWQKVISGSDQTSENVGYQDWRNAFEIFFTILAVCGRSSLTSDDA